MSMGLDCLTLDIQYDIDTDQFKVEGKANEEGRKELVETFLREQISAGEDNRTPIKRQTYHIQLRWHPENDVIEASSDTGNKGLRDGILMQYLKSLDQ